MICSFCKKEILKTRSKRNNTKFCSRECYLEYKKNKRYQEYLAYPERFYGQQNMQNLKKHFLKEQNFKCAICGTLNIWKDSPLIFVLDHIDGDSRNNFRENLRLVCPNCDSQLPTFKSKNKNSTRKRYINITERTVRNDSTGRDDNGELLTDNADDNAVGMD